jgi:hypothetical protein
LSTKYDDIQLDEDIEKTGQMFDDVNEQQDKQEVLRRIRQTQYNKVFGTERGKGGTLQQWDKHDYQNRVLGALEKIAEATEALQHEMEHARKKGQVYSSRMILLVDAHYTHIDLVSRAGCADLPANKTLRVPGMPARKLVITNEGNGILKWGTNLNETSNDMTALLLPGQTYELEVEKHKINFLDIGAIDLDTTFTVSAEI